MLEQVMKNGSLWRGLMLEKFVDDFSMWMTFPLEQRNSVGRKA